jgi:cob(I)alamin adenosyltransferase
VARCHNRRSHQVPSDSNTVAEFSSPRIYTKTGDAGDTGLFDGTRVPKSDARVDAYGEVDEVSACIGLARAHLPQDSDLVALLHDIQQRLFAVGAQLADPRHRIAKGVEKARLDDTHVADLEAAIDRFQAEVPPLRHFVLAGGGPAGASFHLARAVCRRAERRVVGLGPDAVDRLVVVYLNRLSDLLFVLARVANQRAGIAEIEW